MMTNDTKHTLADYVAIAVSPALIMALVGSLVFFLVEVLLGPLYPEQLLWILFFAVFGAVLVSRISMTSEIASRAGIYGMVLGFLLWLSLMIYVKYPATSQLAPFAWLINAVLIVIIWGSAHRLTWDSTLIDDDVDASGAGLLQEAGLEKRTEAVKEPEPVDKGQRRKREPGGFFGWVARFKRHREDVGKRPHAPGVWVVYFSLAALPLFGLGQSLIPPTDAARRRYVFWLLVVYVASGLGLLLTTSFLNLRRYLRQRNLQMPLAMTGVWLTGGVLIIAVLLTLGALIPRPSAEYPLIDVGGAFSVKEREGSRLAKGKEWADKGEPADEARDGGKGATQKGAGKKKSGDKADETAPGKKTNKGGKGESSKDGDGKSDQAKSDEKAGKEDRQKEEPDSSTDSAKSRSDFFGELAKQLMTLLKWIVGGLMALVILFLLLRALLRFLANFTHWAKRLLDSWNAFWEGLRRWWQGRGLPEAVADEPELAKPPRPFAAFRNPFLSGEGERMTPGELVRYTFEALEAWAHERGCGRHIGETPLEFGERLAHEYPALESAAHHLVGQYAGLAYAQHAPALERVDELGQLWRLLVDLVERPMSAA
jgi:hypothetical protein